MSELIVIQGKTRRHVCEGCEFRDLLYAKGEAVQNNGGAIAPEDYFTCDRITGQMPCEMKSMLTDPAARCPHPDAAHRVVWDTAKPDPTGGCGKSNVDRQTRMPQPNPNTDPSMPPPAPRQPVTQAGRRGHSDRPIRVYQ